MTVEDLQENVGTYLSTHIDREFWSNLSDEDKEASIIVATSDIESALNVFIDDISNERQKTIFIKAVGEQALHLARNYESMNEGKILTSEGVEGLSASYTLLKGDLTLSARADLFINQFLKAKLTTPIRILR